jgi:Zn finger protein HypA/HybF involved in hydrogenase expression
MTTYNEHLSELNLSTMPTKRKRVPLFQCLECGRKFYTTRAAQEAIDWGCPKCNGSDIDIYAGD